MHQTTYESPDKSNQENEKPVTEVMDFSKPDFTFTPKGVHEWRQEGYYLICRSCDLQHAIWIGGEKILTGFDNNGKVILKTRKELGMA